MIELVLALLMGASRDGIPGTRWTCRNQVEVWCAADGCAATNADEFTPMDITADAGGALSVCAYSGCWSGKAAVARAGGRYLWSGDDFRFSTASDGARTDVTLVVIAKDGVGFVRAGGFATPLLCTRAAGPAVAPEADAP